MQEKRFKSFDGMISTFQSNIYKTSKGDLRRILVSEDLETIDGVLNSSKQLNVLDLGCGEGYFSLKLASAGHKVTLCDVSLEMINYANTKFSEHNLLRQAKFYCASVFDLPKDVLNSKYDLILCHAMLEWVQNQKECIQIISNLLYSHGYLSLLYYNKDALYFHSLIVGNFNYIDSNFKTKHKQKLTPTNPLIPSDVNSWLLDSEFNILRETGIRVFFDYMRDKQDWNNKVEDILKYERIVCRDPRFKHLGRYQHILAQLSR